MRGACLCGEVEFSVSGLLPDIYQCHCSLCRRVTGSTANAAMIVPDKNFKWERGQEKITSYVKESGYRSDFCSKCGSPVPNPLQGRNEYWIPVGLFEDHVGLEVGAHLYVGSKASWESISSDGVQYQETPGLERLLNVLQKNLVRK